MQTPILSVRNLYTYFDTPYRRVEAVRDVSFDLKKGQTLALGELLAQGKANLNAPWLGITAFAVLAFMLTLLIFVGEAVRDAFDPRKASGEPPPAEGAALEAAGGGS